MSTDPIAPLREGVRRQRMKATPIAEGALTGIAIGAAGSGYRPIMDWRQVTFSFVAMDQIVNQAAKIHYMFGGQRKFPILYRANVGGGTRLAAQHCQCPWSMFMNLSGLKMFLPSTPADLKGLLKSAIRDNNPVISFESNRLLGMKGEVPDGDIAIPLGVADIKRKGTDVTVVAVAWLVHEALGCGRRRWRRKASRSRWSTPARWCRWMAPRSAPRCRRRAVWSSPTKQDRLPASRPRSPRSPPRTRRRSASSRRRCKRVCAANVPIPYSPVLEDFVFPGPQPDRGRRARGDQVVTPLERFMVPPIRPTPYSRRTVVDAVSDGARSGSCSCALPP